MSEELIIKSRNRVIDFGEVFTPSWMVTDMLQTIPNDGERIESRFLEPACGSGNFLVQILQQKLRLVERLYSNNFEKKHFALLSLMSVYGVELLEDNVSECKSNLHSIFLEFVDHLEDEDLTTLSLSAERVTEINIINGDALTYTKPNGDPITFAEWSYLGSGKYKRRDFSYNTLTQMSTWDEGTLFSDIDKADIFLPLKEFPLMTMEEIASA